MFRPVVLLPLFSYGLHLLHSFLFVVLPTLLVCYVVRLLPIDLYAALRAALVVLGADGGLGGVWTQAFGRDRR